MSETPTSEPDPVVPARRREPVETRIGDQDRDQAVNHLREHLAAGRLDAGEFEDRMSRALEARTASQIKPLFDDLPEPKPKTTGPSVAPAFQAPPWQRQSAPTPAVARREGPGVVAPTTPSHSTGLAIAASVAWPITILAITFALGWGQFWWLVFLPIVLSSMAGRGRGGPRHRHGH